MELSILCGCDVALMVFSPADRLYTFSSHGMNSFLTKFNRYTGPRHELTDSDVCLPPLTCKLHMVLKPTSSTVRR